MKQLAVLTLLLIAGLLAWLFASRLSADALGMAVGLIFGVLAGVPAALLVLAANRRPSRDLDEVEEDEVRGRFGPPAPHPYGYQPPVIVVTSPQPAQPQWPGPQTVDSVGYPVRQALPGPSGGHASGRAFKVVGEKEEWLDEW